MQTLFLNNTALEVIAAEALDSMEALDTLHLESNLLESLGGDTFKYQRSLKRLYLHHNRLRSLVCVTEDGTLRSPIFGI